MFVQDKCIALHWRHNDHGGVSNHQPRGCLLNRSFRRRRKKTSKLRVTGLCVGNSPGPVNSPHKRPVTRKMFPFDDVIMVSCDSINSSLHGRIDQSHRYGHHQAACREPAGSYDKTTWTAICFEHKTQYHLIRAPYTRIVVFWHISNIPPMISQSQISCTPTFYIATIFVKYCYTTGSWLL